MRCETEQLTDDVQVATRDGGFIYCQMKRSVTLSTAETSDLSSATDQFVRQYLDRRKVGGGDKPWGRPMTADRDRLVLVTSTSSSGAVVAHLNRALEKLRELPSGLPATVALLTERERTAVKALTTIITRSWMAHSGAAPTDAELSEFLAMVRIEDIEVEKVRLGQRSPIDLLAATVAESTQGAGAAWSALVEKAGEWTASRTGADIMTLRRRDMHCPSG
jgi:hypothetical protein